MMVLLEEFAKDPKLKLHVMLLRHRLERGVSFTKGNVTFHVLKARPVSRLASLFWLDTLLIRRALRNINPDLVHAWGNEKGAAMVAHRLGYPYVMTVQGLYGWYKQLVPLHPYDKLMSRFEALSLKRAPVVTTESNFAVSYLREHHPRIKVVQAEHAPNQVFARVERKPLNKPFNFISIGTLDYRKGTDLLFRALDQLAPEMDFQLTLITGRNNRRMAQLRAQTSEALWSRTEFKHDVPPGGVADHLARATMLLLPTRADTSPNAVKEAVVAGVPVVASKVGGIPDYVISERNGLLFEPGDLEGFTRAIRTAVSHPLFSAGKVELDTLAQMRSYLSPGRMAQNFLRAYQEAMPAL
jgi:glycosyltransferase involved in cell wall biosynthesis